MQTLSKFAVVGIAGFVIDAAIFMLLIVLNSDPMMARVIAFWSAASFTWWGNRRFTFNRDVSQSPLKQWGSHMLVAHFAGGVNLVVFFVMNLWTPVFIAFPVGVGVATVINFTLVNRYVFSTRQAC